MTRDEVTGGDQVVLDVPARPRSLRLLRLAAADAAADLEFDVDAVESARIAVDELASVLLAAGMWSRLVVTMRRQAGGLRVDGCVSGPEQGDAPSRPVQVDRVAAELLAVCVDEFAVTDDPPAFTFSLGGSRNGTTSTRP